ncbi:MAG: hypothetical protein KAS21_04885 [Candidatus Aminicenantes bacterium]|nr:hypothetical protein [Candidatus Aminicenantes bacterium]
MKINSSGIFNSYLISILNKKGNIYRIDHNQVDIDLLGKQIILKNLEISLDQEQLNSSGINQNIFFNVKIPYLTITGISYLDFILFRKISADRIYLKAGNLKLYSIPEAHGKKKSLKKQKRFPSISLGRITIEDTHVEFFTQFNSSPKIGLKSISVDSEKIIYDPEKTPGENFSNGTPGLTFTAGNSFFIFKRTGYKAETENIMLTTSNPSILLKKFKYAPSSEKTRKKIISSKGSFHRFNISEINLKNIDLEELEENKRIRASELHIKTPEIHILRNRNIRRKSKKRGGKLPQQRFRESDLKVELKLIRLNNGVIKYSEIAPGERIAESIFFTKVESSLKDITNFPEILKTGKESSVSVSAELMGKSTLKGKIIIPINHRGNRFSFSGSLEKTNPLILNNFLKKNIRIRIDSGKINHMYFSVKADNRKASGKLLLAYKNLKVTLLRKHDPARKSRFRTFLANTFIYRNNPTKKRRKIRTGKIFYERKVKGSIFNYMWKCILAGIKSSIKI